VIRVARRRLDQRVNLLQGCFPRAARLSSFAPDTDTHTPSNPPGGIRSLKPTRLVLDVDTGTDDAVALMLAALHPALELVGVTTVCGNVPLANTTENTLRVLDHIGRGDIPVFRGAAAPLARSGPPVSRELKDVSDFHDDYLDLPASTSTPQGQPAASYLIERFQASRAASERLVLVATGPLTNVALALKLDANFASSVSSLVVMGGGHEISNITAAAEFNFWADPEAAQVVFNSQIEDITLVPLDATHRALVTYEDCARIRELATPAAIATASIIERRIRGYDAAQPMAQAGAAPVHDAVCVAHLINPSVIACERYHVDVETSGPLTVGRSIIDTHHRGGRAPNAKVAFDADPGLFMSVLLESLNSTT
jgi:inosine-uridine nucleoside N-ribohydrolase